MRSQSPVVKDLVLVGGGHSHVAVLRRFGMKPLPGLRLTLVTRDVHTPYSGMLPGYIAGHYTYDEDHIDLRPLSQFAGARLIHAAAEGLDLENRRVLCAGRPPVPFDLLSINIGSRPAVLGPPGADDHTVPVKPIDRFLAGWEAIIERVLAARGRFRIVVIGGGAGGVELALATQHRLRAELAARGERTDRLEHHLVTDTPEILPALNRGARRRFERVLRERDVRVHTGHPVARVEAGVVHCESGLSVPADAVFRVTHASAPAWLAQSGLDTDAEGFVRVDDCLRSLSHPFAFAAGDIAHMVRHSRPKSGVFAVRQGPPLARNLRRAALGRRPRPFTPQRHFLTIISTGDRYAVAARNGWSVEGRWVWQLKDRIDRRFMRKYNELPEMAEDEDGPKLAAGLADADAIREISAIAMRCGGCGAKVGSTVLARVVNQLRPVARNDVLVGLQEPDDAAIVEVPPGQALVQTVDYFRAFIEDAYVFGRIAANHSLGDLYAMGASPQSAMAIATVPYGREAVVEDQLYQMMAGALEVLNEAGAALVGGHSGEGAELSFGLAVTGLIERERVMRKSGMQPGDALILTKPVGTGTLFAADMRQKAKGRWVAGAIDCMLRSNQGAAEVLLRHGASACTDVTGFGLLGHLVEMTRASGVDAELDLDAVPVLDGALETIRAGVFSSLQPQNVRLRRAVRDLAQSARDERFSILFDPQTAGGLLASVPAERAAACLADLHAQGDTQAAAIGRITAESGTLEPITVRTGAHLN